jgi:hypothetical protein
VNILPNSSFEEGAEAAEFCPMIGDCKAAAEPGWRLDTAEHFHGEKSLRFDGRSPFLWETLGKASPKAVFSVYLKGAAGGEKVEIGVEPLCFQLQGGMLPGAARKELTLDKEWRRYETSASTDEKKFKDAGPTMTLYRAWVKPLSEGKIWADAAQLEPDKTAASEYDPLRTGNNNAPFSGGPASDGPAETPDFKRKKSKTGQITLNVAEGSGVNSEPVRGGVPFPKGELYDERAVRLFDSAGKEIPCQTVALARRHIDGSVTSLLLDFQADLSPGKSRVYTLKYGAEGNTRPEKPLASETPDEIKIDSGAVSAVIGKKTFKIFDFLRNSKGETIIAGSVSSGSYAEAPDGFVFSSGLSGPEEIRVEMSGPLRSVILARGKHKSEKGETLLDYEVRIHAFAGKPYFMIDISYENREPRQNTPVRSLCLRLPMRLKPGSPCVFNVFEGKDIVAPLPEEGELSAVQTHEYYGDGNYEAALSSDGKKARFPGSRLSGTARSGDALLSARDFWRLNPKAISLSADSASVYVWPGSDVKIADIPYGLAMTMTVFYAPFGGPGEDLAQNQPVLQTDPEWTAKSGVFGHYLTAAAAKEKYPRYEKIVEEYFSGLLTHPRLCDLTGALDYGEFGFAQKRVNNETAVNEGLWLQYLRTMDPRLFQRAEAQTKHLRETDTTHLGPDTCYLNTHSGGVHTSYHHHAGHFWISGLIWHYLLTGDMRSYDSARRLGAHLILKHVLRYYQGRERARLLMHLAELYDLTHLKCFKDAYETHYNFGQPTPDSGNYYIGIGLLALKKWFDVTGESKYLDRFREDAAKILLSASPEEIAGGRRFDMGSGRDWYLFEALAECARASGNPDYIKKFMGHFVWHTVKFATADHCAVMGSEFLEAAAGFGVGESPLMPENLLGLGPMTGYQRGGPSIFSLRVTPEQKSAADIKIYRFNSFRVWQSVDQKGTGFADYSLLGDSGSVVKEGKLESDAHGELASVTANAQGSLKVSFNNDAYGDISCEGAKTLINTERMFVFRMPPLGIGFASFYVRTHPSKDKVAVKLTWGRDICEIMGGGAAAMLQDESGAVVARKRWMIPMGSPVSGGGHNPLIPSIDLPVPEKFRGKILKLTVNASKSVGWRIENLESPWMAKSPAALNP